MDKGKKLQTGYYKIKVNGEPFLAMFYAESGIWFKAGVTLEFFDQEDIEEAHKLGIVQHNCHE